ncbi:hypothetical protein C8C77_102145 [Halanaerobium saccharolyticum]|uniref:Uncharacterized protein n=1 Tax=Halanaerobium saccharolyticum TaxID=43595 RepID=A0A4R7Z729_9FIRM|nr:hypothetical protein [Halanaerobium saccharolyticum]RAK09781.1 hypothetical protein C7958_10651 [Halanaerobium saccharolyticum]TDW07343.1 hypothetical protein C8C77_102145 [Halanaerobium saccharolyticum]TDX61222.1 hypothetical protein C7956_10652 [Halanaerobium saccharolyticum]
MSLKMKNIIVLIIVFSIILTPLMPFYQLQAAGIIPLDGLAEAEKLLYGSVSNEPILDRVAAVEQSLYQSKQSGSIVQRTEKIIADLFETTEKSPSLVFLFNTVEWAVSGEIGSLNLLQRISNLEKMISGEVNEGPLKERIKEIHQLTISGREMPVKLVESRTDQLIRIALQEEINSNTASRGEKVAYQVVEDIKIDDTLIIPAGTTGQLEVTEIKEAGKMGQDGDIKIGFPKLTTIDGTSLEVAIEEEAQEENESQKLAIGASVLGTALLGLPGVVVGYFVEGEDETIPAGSELYIQVTERKKVRGLVLE